MFIHLYNNIIAVIDDSGHS